jgi:hypothetical protein
MAEHQQNVLAYEVVSSVGVVVFDKSYFIILLYYFTIKQLFMEKCQYSKRLRLKIKLNRVMRLI